MWFFAQTGSVRRPPLALAAPALVAGVLVLIPLAYLVVRALGDQAPGASGMIGQDGVQIILRTLALAGTVTLVTSIFALPAAWLTTRTDLPARGLFSLLLVMPLAVPPYIMAYALLGLGGRYGLLSYLTGTTVPRLSGFVGAVLALSAYNFPYLYLNLRAGLREIDPSLLEAAHSLGDSPWRTVRRVLIPQLWPAYLTGAMLTVLHVIADFGVVSLMRVDTLSRVLYVRFYNYDLTGAARLGLVLLLVAGVFILIEAGMLRRLRLDPTGLQVKQRGALVKLGWGKPVAVLSLSAFIVATFLLPVAVVAYWASSASLAEHGRSLLVSLWDSVICSAPAAVLATAAATPIALLAARYPGRLAGVVQRLPWLGYAIPALALALALVVLARGTFLYQTLILLVLGYAMHFLAEAVGPLRSSAMRASTRLEDASRSLGAGWWTTIRRVTLPLLRQGLGVSLALVFLSCLKELPITMLLAPIGVRTLAVNVWTYAEDALFADAAPYALLIIALAGAFVGVLLWQGRSRA